MGWLLDADKLDAEINESWQECKRDFESKGDVSTHAQITLALDLALLASADTIAHASHRLRGYHDEMAARIDGLEARVRELECRIPEYRGVFRSEESYRKNAIITDRGSLWLAMVDSPAGRPGASTDWKLIVRRGEDGKDLRDPVRLTQR